MTKYSRKHVSKLENKQNDEQTISVTVNIESNHLNTSLDLLQQSIINQINIILNSYKEIEKKKKEKPVESVIKKKKKTFDAGYV